MGKREYSGNIGQDDFSFPVTSLRESIVMTLYNANRELISKAELKTKAIVESGTTDVVFTLDSGGKVVLQLQFLLSDEDRKRIQEMRNSAMKRKQQELLGNGYEFYFQDGPLFKQLIEKISNIPSKGDQPTLRKSMSLDDLQERAILSGINVDPHTKASKTSLLQSGGNTSRFEDHTDSKKEHGKTESRSSSEVKKMVNTFESSSSQGLTSMTRIKSESSLKGMSVSSETSTKSSTSSASMSSPGRTQTGLVAGTSGKVTLPSGDTGFSSRSGRHVMLGDKKSNASGQTGLSNSRRRSSSSRDVATKQNMREHELSRSKKRPQAKHRRPMGPYSLEQMHSMGLSRYYLHQYPLNYLVATSGIWIHPHVCITTASRQLKDLLELEHLNSFTSIQQVGSKRLDVKEDIEESTSDDETRNEIASTRRTDGFPMLDGWLINQGVRVVIVIIACGAIFLNNR